jgi:hypothetical protein
MRNCATKCLWRITFFLVFFAAVLRHEAATVSFTWDPSPDAASGKVQGYKVYYSAVSFSFLPADVATNPAFTIVTVSGRTTVDLPNLVDGRTYFITVTAFGSGLESLPSNILAYTVGGALNVPPTVALTSPASNAQFSAGQTISVSATAADIDGTISRVDFFDGATLIGTRSATPYSISVSSLSSGSHNLTARAIDNVGATTTSAQVTITVNSPVNVPPTVALTSPANNAQFSVGQSVTISASPADADGAISRVDFFDGATLVGTRSAAPYSISTSSLSSGSHTLTARAVDNAGATTASSPVTITVNAGGVSPTVAFTSPANNAQFSAGQAITFNAAASAANPIARVEFFDGASIFATEVVAPYEFDYVFAAGTHVVTAKVIDSLNNTATSAPITVTVLPASNVPPTVALTSPANNAQFTAGQSVTVSASPADSDGTISRVDFFDGANLVGTRSVAPYSISISSLSTGSHTLTAKAVDNSAATTTSAPITITVNPPANVPPTVALTSPANNAQFTAGQSVTISASAADSDGTISNVDFFDGATLIGTRLAAPYSISISSLSTGSHTLTAKAVDNSGATTTSAPATITVNPPANVPPTVALTSPVNNAQFTAGQSVNISASAADSDGTISRVDFFDGATLIGTTSAAPYSVSLSTLSSGSHTLTAKAVDNVGATTTSAPVTITVVPANVPPTVALTSPANNAQFTAVQSVTVTATAADSDGTIARVDFFDGATLVGSKSSAPYSVTLASLSSGSHTLSAKAVDNVGAVTTSTSVTITINADANSLPTISLTGLTEGDLLSQPVALIASASDADGAVASVEFFANDSSLGSATTAPFAVSVPLISGTYVFKAKATDNSGGSSFSAPITAVVKPAPPVGLTIK